MENVINIKNIDLTVEINNPFLKEEEERKERKKNEFDNKSNFNFNSHILKGNKLGGNIANGYEEMRLARLKKFNKNTLSKNKNIEI